MKSVGIVANSQKPNIRAIVEYISGWLKERGVNFSVTYQNLRLASDQYIWENRHIGWRPEVVIALGGDGTVIQTARVLAKEQIPILGINLGHMGFLTAVELAEIELALDALVNEKFLIETRMMLEAKVFRADKEILQSIALNDVVVKTASVRLFEIDVIINGERQGQLEADGVVVSSPTGSTAYSRSAGGPVVPPYLDCMMLTPICPTSLTAKPLLLGPEDTLSFVVKSDSDGILALDGQIPFQLKPDDQIVVCKAYDRTALVKVKEFSFYKLLKEKLNIRLGKDYTKEVV